MDRSEEIKSEVYNWLSELVFKSGATRAEIEAALEWFTTHFYEAWCFCDNCAHNTEEGCGLYHYTRDQQLSLYDCGEFIYKED